MAEASTRSRSRTMFASQLAWDDRASLVLPRIKLCAYFVARQLELN